MWGVGVVHVLALSDGTWMTALQSQYGTKRPVPLVPFTCIGHRLPLHRLVFAMSNMSRDDFIAAMISELEKQKSAQGNAEVFFTGGFLSASDVFRKMCFDFPLVDDHALQILLVGLQTIRLSAKPHELRSVFQLNPKFLENISYLQQQTHSTASSTNHMSKTNQSVNDSDDDEVEGQPATERSAVELPLTATATRLADQPNDSKRSAILSKLSIEIYLYYPLYLFRLPRDELASLLSEDMTHVMDRSQRKVVSSFSWTLLYSRLRDILLQAHAPLFLHSTEGRKSLSAINGPLENVISLVRELRMLLDDTVKEDQQSLLRSHNAHLNALQFFAQQRQRQETHNGAVANEGSEVFDYAQLQSIVQEMCSHLVQLVVDLICQLPELVPLYFPKLLDTLVDRDSRTQGSRLAVSTGFSRSLRTGDYLSLMALCHVSTFLAGQEDIEAVHGVASRMHIQLARESIRKYLAQRGVLSHVLESIDFIRQENIRKALHNKAEQAILANENDLLDLESGRYLVEIAELVCYLDRTSTGSSASFAELKELVLTTRLLASLLQMLSKVLMRCLDKQLSLEMHSESAVVWQISCRLIRVLTLFAMVDSDAARYIAQYPRVMDLLPMLLSGVRSHYALFCPALVLPISVSVALTLSSSADAVPMLSLVDQTQDWTISALESIDLVNACHKISDGDGQDDIESDAPENSTELQETQSAEEKQRELLRRHDLSRLLESLVLSTSFLHHDELRHVRSRMEVNAQRKTERDSLLSSLQRHMTRVLRTVTRIRSTVAQLREDSVIHQFEKIIKNAKAVVSLLEGDQSSKTD